MEQLVKGDVLRVAVFALGVVRDDVVAGLYGDFEGAFELFGFGFAPAAVDVVEVPDFAGGSGGLDAGFEFGCANVVPAARHAYDVRSR